MALTHVTTPGAQTWPLCSPFLSVLVECGGGRDGGRDKEGEGKKEGGRRKDEEEGSEGKEEGREVRRMCLRTRSKAGKGEKWKRGRAKISRIGPLYIQVFYIYMCCAQRKEEKIKNKIPFSDSQKIIQ